MANGHDKHAPQNGNANTKSILAIIASTGILGVISAGYMAVANDARIAITVAEQHGQEILLIRGEIASLREEMRGRTVDRYTARDHEAYERYMEQRLKELEEDIQRCCSK
jgi:hypothetical protein